MGEYANYNGEKIKIGTCESMYYLRYDDRAKVKPEPGSVNPLTESAGLSFRLPFTDEDHLEPGNYEHHSRGYSLYMEDEHGRTIEYTPLDLEPGTLQLRHPLGLIVSVPCTHGIELPKIEGAKAGWNGKRPHLELVRIKDTGKGLKPLFECKACGMMWTCDFEDIGLFIRDEELKNRLFNYAKGGENGRNDDFSEQPGAGEAGNGENSGPHTQPHGHEPGPVALRPRRRRWATRGNVGANLRNIQP